MLEIETSVELQAPPWRIWKALTRLDDYARWHPFIESSGVPALGAKVDYSFRNRAFQRRFTATATIVRLDEPSVFGWRVGIKGLVLLDEMFHIEESEQGATLRHRMTCRGALARVAARTYERRLRAFIVEIDRALDVYLRGADNISDRNGNRKKRRSASSRARHTRGP